VEQYFQDIVKTKEYAHMCSSFVMQFCFVIIAPIVYPGIGCFFDVINARNGMVDNTMPPVQEQAN